MITKHPPPKGMVPNFEPKNDLKKVKICIFGLFLGPNDLFPDICSPDINSPFKKARVVFLGTNLLKLISKGTICPQELISNLDSPRELMSVWGPNGLAILSGSDVLRGPLFLGDLINVH